MIRTDISYLVADLKYSKQNGLKICEVQHGATSMLTGDIYLNGDNGLISLSFANFFDHLPMNKWITGAICNAMKKCLETKNWQTHRSMKVLSYDPTFLQCAKIIPDDPTNITTYKGIVYGTRDIIQDYNKLHDMYPGILFIDAITLPYWIDKYKMNELFNNNDELKEYKADWQMYPKKYNQTVAKTIQETMPSELYIIKPRKEFLANGVIVVTSEELDNTLQTILNSDNNLKKHKNKSYSYWNINRNDTFLIEKYYKSDYLYSTKLNNNYDPTMRIAFILQYNQGVKSYHCLGGYWKLPSKSTNELGTNNEKCITCCTIPFYESVEPELFEQVNKELEKAMLLLYQVMLDVI